MDLGFPTRPLFDLAEVRAGSPAPQGGEYFSPDGIPFVRVQDVGRYGRTTNLLETKDRINQHAIEIHRPTFAKKGTIVFPKSGAAINTNSRAILGIDAYVVSHLAMANARDELAITEWLYYYLCSIDMAQFSRTAALPSLRLSELRELPVPYTSIEEQRRIVTIIKECMERIDEVAELFESQQDDYTELKLSLVLGTSSEHSEWMRVGELVDWIQDSEPVFEGSTYQFAGMRSFGNGIFHNSTKGSADFAYKSLRRLKYHDFIYPKLMAWEGAFGMVTQDFEDYVVSPEFVVFRPKNGAICPEVLDTYFRSPYCLQQVRDASTGTNRRRNRLNPKAFLTLQMPFPSIEKQRHLVEVYRIEEEAKRDWKDRQEGLAALRESILHKAFSGEF